MVYDEKNIGFGSLFEYLKRYENAKNNVNADNISKILFDNVLKNLRVREIIDADYIEDLVKECWIPLNRNKSNTSLRMDITYWLSACKYLGLLKSSRLNGEYMVQPDWQDKFQAALKGFRCGVLC
jgi:hypothetical protein